MGGGGGRLRKGRIVGGSEAGGLWVVTVKEIGEGLENGVGYKS